MIISKKKLIINKYNRKIKYRYCGSQIKHKTNPNTKMYTKCKNKNRKKMIKEPYSPKPAYTEGMLQVDETNKIYWQISGNPNGIPVIFVHGGPGGGTSENSKIFFDPQKYKIILFDQRGCGKSTPSVSDNPNNIKTNTTQNLISDMEKLRIHLNIDKWLVFGGSWGSTLSLLYAQHYPEKVTGLILRGIFTARQMEVDWLFENGAKKFNLQGWLKYSSSVKTDPSYPSLLLAYNKALFSEDEKTAQNAALAWSQWESNLCTLQPKEEKNTTTNDEHIKSALEIARIENHFFMHSSWLKNNEILDNTDIIKHIPTTIVQGKYDLVCTPDTAYELHKKLPNSKLILTVAGHSPYDQENLNALICALDEYKSVTTK